MDFKSEFKRIVLDGIDKGDINLSKREVVLSQFNYIPAEGGWTYVMPGHFYDAIPKLYLDRIEAAWKEHPYDFENW